MVTSKSLISIFYMILIIIFSIFVVGTVQYKIYRDFKKVCDDKFGIDNWKLNEITGTGQYKSYIGQVWNCSKK